jgi:hypothetical protein
LLRIAKLSEIRRRCRAALAEPPSHDLSLFREVLAAARDAVGSWGGTLHFVYLPAWERFGDPGAASSQRAEVLEMARQLELPTLDLTETFLEHGDPRSLFPLGRPGHYTPEGYAAAARTIALRLSAEEGSAGP